MKTVLTLLCIAFVLIPAAAWSLDVDLMLSETNSSISDLNPATTNFDVVYSAGPVKTSDGSTTLGNWMCIVPRTTAGNFNLFDCVLVFAPGNIYYKQVLNFATGEQQGTVIGGDGPFQGISGSVSRISGFVYRFSLSLP